MGGAGTITAGVTLRGASGEPSNALGGHALYGVDQVYILPRGSGDRLPWTYGTDLSVSYTFRFTDGIGLTAGVDVFNIFNFQAETVRDQRYTSSAVSPVTRGTSRASHADRA